MEQMGIDESTRTTTPKAGATTVTTAATPTLAETTTVEATSAPRQSESLSVEKHRGWNGLSGHSLGLCFGRFLTSKPQNVAKKRIGLQEGPISPGDFFLEAAQLG